MRKPHLTRALLLGALIGVGVVLWVINSYDVERATRIETYKEIQQRINGLSKPPSNSDGLPASYQPLPLDTLAGQLAWQIKDQEKLRREFLKHDAWIFGSMFAGLGALAGLLVFALTRLVLLALKLLPAWPSEQQAEADRLAQQLGSDFGSALVRLTFKYLDAYYSQTHQQAEKLFALATLLTIVSFSIGLSGIVMLYYGSIEPGRVSVGVGAIAQLLASGIFGAYYQSAKRMQLYHDKLVVAQNVNLAVKLAESLEPGRRDELRSFIAESLVRDVSQPTYSKQDGNSGGVGQLGSMSRERP